jgi:hypothetical protein
MTTRTVETSPQSLARLAGLLYLLLLPLGIFGMAVAGNLVVPGDPAASARNILAAELPFRLGIVSALLVQVVNVVVVVLLYRLLKPVNATLAALMVIFLLLGVPIAMLNELNQLAVLWLLNGTGAAAASAQSWVPFFLDLHALGIQIAGIFWGLWLFPMGYLVYKSGFLPKVLGILLMIGCAGYLVDSFAALLAPGLHIQVALFTFWGEVLLPLWLLIKGVNLERWGTQVLATA